MKRIPIPSNSCMHFSYCRHRKLRLPMVRIEPTSKSVQRYVRFRSRASDFNTTFIANNNDPFIHWKDYNEKFPNIASKASAHKQNI